MKSRSYFIIGSLSGVLSLAVAVALFLNKSFFRVAPLVIGVVSFGVSLTSIWRGIKETNKSVSTGQNIPKPDTQHTDQSTGVELVSTGRSEQTDTVLENEEPNREIDDEIVQVTSDLIIEKAEQHKDRFTLRYNDVDSGSSGGSFELIDHPEPLTLYDEMLLYLLVAARASVAGIRENPVVTGEELNSAGYEYLEIAAFLSRYGHFIEGTKHDWSPEAYLALPDAELQLNYRKVSEISEEIGKLDPISASTFNIGFASKNLTECEKACRDLDGTQMAHDRLTSEQKLAIRRLLEAMWEVQKYPTVVGRDNTWNSFVNCVGATIDWIESGNSSSAIKCLDRAKSQLETIAKRGKNSRASINTGQSN
ncbi:hypothetical protein KU306_07640 [Haloferax larsenii]|uniref:Uncharacterized protein n=1 Tax=Haloferax larsenii TaxID=302484 RepID=A0ABY5RHU0_HALLR|nr:hypothetical protein [Haloferax larsenii]UVE51729.1 hypothetical protein KU306_07640 [Haloferax larsenii]